MRIVGVIPSRFGSTRFPGKPLALIKGERLIERVWKQAKKCRLLDEVIIATDDRRIASCASSFGARAVLTSRRCASGTDRLAEVAARHEKKAGIFINIQGDEPLIPPGLIDKLALTLKSDKDINAVTAVYPIKDAAEIEDPNVVKAVIDEEGFALYFSRYPIPYVRTGKGAARIKHLGIYGYRRDFLLEFSKWKPATLEKLEQLEQLRILENGYRIKTVMSPADSFGVDVPDDVKKIEMMI